VPLPKPSAETRESYVKLVSQFAEKAKQNLR
jgi:ribosome recycling factor